jgi:hypothetical protein
MAGADAFVVQTITGAALVRAGAGGVVLQARDSHDGGHLGFLTFEGAAATAIAADMASLRDQAALVLSGQLLGIAETAFDITLAYLKDRRQFDQPIGAFQALQHRMVDLYLELTLMRAAVDSAAAASTMARRATLRRAPSAGQGRGRPAAPRQSPRPRSSCTAASAIPTRPTSGCTCARR